MAGRWTPFGPPVVVFNKSHSGSRLLTRLLIDAGVFMGADRNDSEDSADLLRLVMPLVNRWYPHYADLMRQGDVDLAGLVEDVFARHLDGHDPGGRWGWKLCESLYILPVLHRLFPQGWFVHLIRDGRDVAFSDHVAPFEPFWRKVYFDTAGIAAWRGLPLTHDSYRRQPHLFNARHWVNSVTVARHYGAMIGARYIEVRYEDLVCRPEATARALLAHLGLDPADSVIEAYRASAADLSVGKHRRQPARHQHQALKVLRPTLAAFGYDDPPERPRRSWRRRIWPV